MRPDWALRRTPPELARHYGKKGYWDDATFAGLLRSALERNGRAPVTIRSASRPFRGTVADVGDAGLRLASHLRAQGVGPGDVVAFQLPNWSEAVSCYVGLLALGVVLVPVVHIYGHRELTHILRQSGARALITADRFGRQDFIENLLQIAGEVPDLEHVVVVESAGPAPPLPQPSASWTDVVASCDPFDDRVELDPDEPVLVGYTSGTTAAPKGVIHTHRSFLGEMRTFMSFLAEDRAPFPPGGPGTLSASPISHVTGLVTTMRVLLGGGSLNLMDVWSSSEMLRAMEEDGLALSGGATFFLVSVLEDPGFDPGRHVPLMNRLSLGGAPVPAEVVRRASELGISMVRAYGSTEHPSTTISLHSDPFEKRSYTDGRAITGTEIRIVDESGQGLGPGHAGEILTRGPDLFVGYTDPGLTAEAVDADGWYRTGDVGHLDEEGYLTITDRKKDIIIRGGENVSAQEVEELLARLPGVAESAVVAAPDRRYGEHGCAMVRLQPGADRFDLARVQDWLKERGLARQKWPEELRFVEDFPRTASGKVQKHVLRAQLAGEGP